jgi:hypothetical protein
VLIDCDACQMQGTAHCRDCVVTAIVGADDADGPSGAIVIDADEERAIRELSRAGLVPTIRMRRRSEPA